MTDRRRAFHVVDEFEAALAEYTGAPFVVTTDSCTNALFLSLMWYATQVSDEQRYLTLPRHTYVGVVQAARNAGWETLWTTVEEVERWEGFYVIGHTPIVDAAKLLFRDMYVAETITCISFQASKRLPIGRGGAILLDDEEAATWLRRARLDGRIEGAPYEQATFQRPGFHCYMDPPSAARGLWLLTYLEDDDPNDWSAYPDLSQAVWT